MGFSWAVYFARRGMENLHRTALPGCRLLADHTPPARFSKGKSDAPPPHEGEGFVYVDNLMEISVRRESAERCRDLVAVKVEGAGLKLHEFETKCADAHSLGCDLKGEEHWSSCRGQKLLDIRAAIWTI